MEIRFKSKKATTVKFSKSDQSAADLVIYNLAEYGKHMTDPDIDALSDQLQKACGEIGMLPVVEGPKE